MDKYPDFWSVLLGSQPIGFILGYIVISYLSAMGIILVMAAQKYNGISNSPEKWSWKYFWANNAGNFIACLFILPIAIRLVTEFVADARLMLLISVGVGFGFYKLAKLANKFGIWTTDKLSEKISEKIKQTEIKQNE